jgi:hypothetical protein
MKNYIWIVILLWAIPTAAQTQIHQEPVFGLNLPISHWGILSDEQFFGVSQAGYIGIPSDAVNLRFVSGVDTTDIILILDRLTCQIRWLRCQANRFQRPLQNLSCYGTNGDSIGQFQGPTSMAIASEGPLYDPATDHIYVADRMNHRLVSLNFDFHPVEPQSDSIIWESFTTVDTEFFPISLIYIDLSSISYSNKLIALDDIGERLAIYSHQGELLSMLDLDDPADSISHIYSAITYKINPDSSIALYLADRAQGNIRQYKLSLYNDLQFTNELHIIPAENFMLTDVTFSPIFGLCAIDDQGPHIFQINEDLSSVIRELGTDDFDQMSLFHPYKMLSFPERLVVFECNEDETGIVTFAYDQQFGKRENMVNTLPKIVSLSQNYPNPFNPATSIRYSLPASGHIRLTIYDILGRRVAVPFDGAQTAGNHNLTWDASAYPSGLYFARLEAGEKSQSIKMILLK